MGRSSKDPRTYPIVSLDSPAQVNKDTMIRNFKVGTSVLTSGCRALLGMGPGRLYGPQPQDASPRHHPGYPHLAGGVTPP